MGKFIFWQKPQDANEAIGHENRKVSWLELFFDIYFVCAIAAVGHILVADMTMHGFNQFVMVFIPVWWIWIGFTYYNERFETFGFENRFFTFLMMIPVAGLAIFSHDAMHHNFVGFALSYALGRSILGFLYGRAAYYIPSFRLTGLIYALCFSISVAIIVIMALFAPTVSAVNVFGLVLVFDLFIPFIAAFTDGTFTKLESLNVSEKITERFGLFCIIVIGELIVAVISGISSLEHATLNDIYIGLVGLAIAMGMWWIYFDFIARRGPNRKPIQSFLWTYLHMPLVMSFIGLSAGILYSIEHAGGITDNARLLIGFSAGIVLMVVGLIEWVSFRHKDEPSGHIMSSALKFLTGTIVIMAGRHSYLETLPLMLVIFGALAINMAYGLWIWFNMPEDSEYETSYIG